MTQAITIEQGTDAGIAWHYGDPFAEQRALEHSAGVIVRDNRDVLTVSGPERLDWLHSITSQYFADLAEGDSVQSLVLSPNGHVEQHWWATELGQRVWLDTEPGQGVTVLEYLRTMVFLKRVEPQDVSGQWAVLTLAGPASAEVLAAAGLAVPAVGCAQALSGSAVPGEGPASEGPAGFVRRDEEHVVDLLVPRAASAAWFARLAEAGARPVGQWAYEAQRVAHRRPRLGWETDHRTIPHEVGWIGVAVHLHKGCYRGQETVARVQNLGKPPRRLVLLHLDGASDELPAAGTAVELAGRTVGVLGTAVQHYELGPVALALVKRTVADDAELRVAGAGARIG